VAVPSVKIDPMREALESAADRVQFIDMTELGRNPGRIIPRVRQWVDAQQTPRCRFIGEPIWPGRTHAETVEATRHEALINLAFAGAPVTILCPYEVRGLDPAVVADARRTHPHVIRAGEREGSREYGDPLDLWRAGDWPMESAQGPVASLPIDLDLAGMRRFVSTRALALGLSGERAGDLVLAVTEAASNALIHATEPGELRIWRSGAEVICEVTDRGELADPLAGRRRPEPSWPSGRGLWLINQLCDLVELRPTEHGTAARMHFDLARAEAARHPQVRLAAGSE
jgi:anti-sigma regulatory factor (Ser/Thr protein kinase)